MASASTKPKETPARKRKQGGGPMQFVGPAQQSFESFPQLARFMLDTNYPKWNDHWKPISYILPPTFPFINPDKSDQDIELDKEAHAQDGLFDRPNIDRQSDQGEFVIFHALWALSQENLRNSFLAVRGLDLQRLMVQLKQIFPSATSDLCVKFKEMMREYDFILMGPRIGVIVIEVKSSAFTKTKDFSPKSKQLPDGIVDGVKQLNSFNLEFFHECAGIQQLPAVPLRKILFTPNLEKVRYRCWYGGSGLEGAAKCKVDNILTGITHWFMDEDLPRNLLKPALCSSLRQLIQADGFQLPMGMFELYGPIIAGLQSAQIFHGLQSTQTQSQFTSNCVSISAAILRDALALDNQDPRKLLRCDQAQSKRGKIDVDGKSVVHLSSKMILLTPEQQQILNGPNRQFIIGPPGTGKTILLQAKALAMLKEGKSVLVLSNSNFMEHYRKLFDDHGFENYEIWSLSKLLRDFISPMEELIAMLFGSAAKNVSKIVNDSLTSAYTTDLQLEEFDAIFIDDAVDDARIEKDEAAKTAFLMFTYMSIVLNIMTFDNYDYKLIWIALDPFLPLGNGNIYGRLYQKVLELMMMEIGWEFFSCFHLDRVMRCSESVFQATYCPEISAQMAVKPTFGNKIHGFADCVSLCFFDDSTSIYCKKSWTINQQIKLTLWKHIHHALDRFRQEGFHYGQMAVIIGSLGPDNRDDRVSFCQFISNKCREYGISTIGTEDMLSGGENLVVDHWHNMSSLEWPVVIFATCESHAISHGLNSGYERYRACSRATMRLFQVIAHYNLRKRCWEADICKGSNGRYVMAPNEASAKIDQHMSDMSQTTEHFLLYKAAMESAPENNFGSTISVQSEAAGKLVEFTKRDVKKEVQDTSEANEGQREIENYLRKMFGKFRITEMDSDTQQIIYAFIFKIFHILEKLLKSIRNLSEHESVKSEILASISKESEGYSFFKKLSHLNLSGELLIVDHMNGQWGENQPREETSLLFNNINEFEMVRQFFELASDVLDELDKSLH